MSTSFALAAAIAFAAAPSTSSPAPAAPAGADPLRLLSRLAVGEPSAAQVQDAAWAQAERSVADPLAVAERRRLAAWLPTLSAEVKADQQTYRVVGLQSAGEVDYVRSSPGTSVLVRATWELGDLISARTEPQAASAALSRARRRDEAVRRATVLYFERRRIQLLLALDPPAAPLARGDVEIDLERATAELDVLTGGLYAARAPR
jgi:hypothetical protein